MTRAGNLYNWMLSAAIFLAVSKSPIYLGLTALRPTLLLMLASAAYWALNPSAGRMENIVRYWPGKVMIALACLACGSAVFGISQGRAGTAIIDSLVTVWVLIFLAVATVGNPIGLKRLVWAFLLGITAISWISFFITGLSKTQNHASYDANDTGLFLVVSLPLAVWLFRSSGRYGRMLAAACFALNAFMIPKTESRGTFLGLLAVIGGILLLHKGISIARKAMVLGVVALVFALGASEYWTTSSEVLTNPTEDYNWNALNGRRQVAIRGIGYMLDYPLFGLGVSNFPMAEGQISDQAVNRVWGTGLRWTSAHNSFVQAGAEMGVMGLVLWSSLIFGSLAHLLRLRARFGRGTRRRSGTADFVELGTTYLPVAWLGFAVCAFFVSFAYYEPVYLLAVFSIGIIRCARAAHARQPCHRTREARHWSHS